MDFQKENTKVFTLFQEYKNEQNEHWDAQLIQANANVLDEEVKWLRSLLDQRITEMGEANATQVASQQFSVFPAPDFKSSKTPYAQLVQKLKLTAEERMMLICSLVPHFSPETLTERLGDQEQALKVRFPAAGGFINRTFRSYSPTFQTALWLINGNDHSTAVYNSLLLLQSRLFKERVLTMEVLETIDKEDNQRNKALFIAGEYVNFLVSGDVPRPDFGRSFPASLVTTHQDWADLVLNKTTMDRVMELCHWMEHGEALIQLGEGKINPSFPCLFYGPPGTGKSMTAKLIGKQFGKHVFRIDLSMIVSKYIGETEKNLARLFDSSEGKDWILFFDEAESLFSKRTEVSSSNDKWANLEVSYLLTRMEEYKGLTILATNIKENLDSAMVRRFQAMIEFGRPETEEREKLWRTAIPKAFSYDKALSFDKLISYNLTGANIANIIKTACLSAMHRKTKVLNSELLSKAIMKELAKENRTP